MVKSAVKDPAALEAQLEAEEAQRIDAREVLRLLYDTGPSHERAVRRALRELGAEVEEPVETNKTREGRSKNRRVVVIVLA